MKKKKKSVFYVVTREDLLSPLINTQVLDVLKNQSFENKIIVWFYGAEKLLTKNYLSERKRKLEEVGLRSIFIPLISYRFPVTCWQMPLVAIQMSLSLLAIRIFWGPSLFHPRSYHSGFAALIVNRIAKVPFIFDPRSPFPEENVMAKGWSKKGFNYRAWKFIEKEMVKNSAAVVITSPFLPMHYNLRDGGNKEYLYIPNNYPGQFEEQFPRYKKSTNDKLNNGIELIYCGSLGHWNNHELYIDFYSNIKRFSCKNVSLTMITNKTNHKIIEGYARKKGVYVQCRESNQDDVLAKLSKACIGLYLMEGCDARLGVKTVEYLFSGLPVIVSDKIKGASCIIRNNKLGLVLEESTTKIEIADFIKDVMVNKADWESRCHIYARENFSPKKTSKDLADLYLALL